MTELDTDQPPFYVNETPLLGKELFASRDLDPGELILLESPAIRIPSWPNDPTFESQVTCLTCGALLHLQDESHNSSLYKCTVCTWHLCSVHCQTDPVHESNECALFSSIGLTFPPESEFSPKRIDWLIAVIRASFMKLRCPPLFENLMCLQHIPQLPVTELVQEMIDDIVEAVLLTPPMKNAGFCITREELIRLMWIVKLNGFTCSPTDQEERQGSHFRTMDCVYVATSRLNNSCTPNCTYITNSQPPFKIMIRTAVKVTKGQPLTINYFPYGGLPTSEREKLIRSRYWFTCKCQRCQDSTENETFMEAIACSSCQSQIRRESKGHEDWDRKEVNLGYFLPDGDDKKMRCNRCSRTQKLTAFSSSLQSLRKLVNELQPESIQNGEYSVHSQDAGLLFDLVKNHVTNPGQLHPNHWIVQLAAQKLVDFYTKDESFETTEIMRNYKKLCVYLLNIQEKLFPGRSLITAGLQLDLCSALFENLMATADCSEEEMSTETGNEERRENLNLCLETTDKALPVFESFQTDQDSGQFKVCSELLTTIKKSVQQELLGVESK